MAISNVVEICNIALKLLGAQSITSLTDGSARAELCSTLIEPARDAVLRELPWNFAQRRVELVANAQAPVFGWMYAHTLPGDPYCLRVNAVWPDDIEYVIEGRDLLADTTPVFIRYTARVTDVSQYDPMFVEALAAKLAWQMALPLTEQTSIARQAGEAYAFALAKARTTDGQEGSPPRISRNPLADVRRHSARMFTRNWKVI